MQMYRSPLYLTRALDMVGWSKDAQVALLTGKRPSIHRPRGWVGSRTGLDGCLKFRFHRDSIHGVPYGDLDIFTMSVVAVLSLT